MPDNKVIWFGILVICVVVLSLSVNAEEQRYFLLEANAKYQLEFAYVNSWESIPPVLSVYTYGDYGKLLNVGKLYQGLSNSGLTHVSMVFETPQGFERATALINTNVELTQGLSIERLSNFEPERQSRLAELIVNEKVYTGLIVDARGLDLERGISPRIWSESGELIYGGVAAPHDYIQKYGVISYGSSVSPELMKRVSIPGKLTYSAPLIVEAQDVIGKTNTGVIISQQAADKILQAINNYDFFANYAVVILID